MPRWNNGPSASTWTSAPRHPRLADREAHVWRARLDGCPAQLHELLSADERTRAQGFRSKAIHDRWAAAHVFLRLVLGRYVDTPPARIAFELDPDDKPNLADGSSALRFNLSHAGDLALVGVAHAMEIGVDLEVIDHDRDSMMVARRALPRSVVDDLERVPEAERVRAFFTAWVRHEARQKCLGTGLIEPEEIDDDEAGNLTVVTLHVEPGYTAALALSAAPSAVARFDWTWPSARREDALTPSGG